MTEFAVVRDVLPQAVQALGLIAPAIACCYVNLKRNGVIKYFGGPGKDYYDTTGNGLLDVVKMKLMAHDHEVSNVKPDTKKGQLVVLIPRGGAVDKFVVERADVHTIDFLQEGEQIPGTDLKHNHSGKLGMIGPWEH